MRQYRYRYSNSQVCVEIIAICEEAADLLLAENVKNQNDFILVNTSIYSN